MAGRVSPRVFAAVGAGGMLGTLLRAAVGELTATSTAGTLIVNLLGAAVLGLLVGLAPFPNTPGSESTARAFITTGLLGGFTTYSALALEVATLPGWTGAGYGLLTVVGGMGLAVAGILAGRRVHGGREECT